MNEALHPGDALGDKFGDGFGLGVEFVPIALEEELGVGGDQAQRFLQVVRGHVGELFEFLVGAFQVGQEFLRDLFRLLALVDFFLQALVEVAQLPGALLHAQFEPVAVLAQCGRHVVEGASELLEFSRSPGKPGLRIPLSLRKLPRGGGQAFHMPEYGVIRKKPGANERRQGEYIQDDQVAVKSAPHCREDGAFGHAHRHEKAVIGIGYGGMVIKPGYSVHAGCFDESVFASLGLERAPATVCMANPFIGIGVAGQLHPVPVCHHNDAFGNEPQPRDAALQRFQI